MLASFVQILRRLRRRPALAASAILVLALAIGANTAIFSLLDTVALRPLPFRDPDRLLEVGAAVPGLPTLRPVSWPKFQHLPGAGPAIAGVAAYYEGSFALTETGRPEELDGARVSGGFFDVLGIAPLIGRVFAADEQTPGGANVVVLSYGFWQERFARDPAILGRAIDLEGVPTTVVGVLPREVGFPFGDVRVWLPRPDEASFLSLKLRDLGAGYLQVVARLAPGATLAQARGDLDRAFASYKADFPGHIDVTYPLAPVPIADALVGPTRQTLTLLLAAVGVVLLVACADVASLLLADGLARRREIATRIALGARRRDLVGDAIREGLLLSAVGGVLGALGASAGLRLLVAANPADLPRIAEASVSTRALAFACAATLLAGLLAALAPVWQTLGGDPRRFLVEENRASTGAARTNRAQGVLVAGEVALALVLLSAAGLLLRSLERVRALELGFKSDDLAIVQVTLPAARYPGVAERARFFQQLLDRVRESEGIESAALVEYPPTLGAPHTTATLEGRPPRVPGEAPLVQRLFASDGYLRTLQTRFVEGRDFDARTPADAPPTALVNRSLAKLLSPDRSPVGERLRLRSSPTPIEIIGVVEDVQQDPVEAGRGPIFYLSERQAGAELSPPNFMYLVVRASLPMETIAKTLRSEVAALDPGQPLPEVSTMNALLATATSRRSLTTGLFSGLAALALALCLLGIYGVVAHAIGLRRRELGIRMALGARPVQVVALGLRLGARWILPGLVAGAIGSALAARALASQLFGVAPAAWLHFAAAALLLGAVAFFACLVPSRAATRVDLSSILKAP